MPKKNIEKLIDVAMKREPADLVIKNAKVYNVFTGEFTPGDVAVADGRVAGVGRYEGRAEEDAEGGWLTPGLMDGHVHIESGMAAPAEFARAVVPLGTTTIIADPHEIANVAGVAGIRYILDATENLPLNVYVMLPSCVPAAPFGRGGAVLTAADLAPLLDHPRVLGLGEMMNYPGVINKDPEVMAKLKMAEGRMIDGHSPGLAGDALTAYAAAGIQSDHECSTVKEARERLALGLAVMLRQGSAARNMMGLLGAVDEHTLPFCLTATDDRHPEDLVEEGHINYMLRLAVNEGKMKVPTMLNMATLNGARHFGLRDIGAAAPGYRADLALFPDLENWKPSRVWKDGRLVAQNGEPLWTAKNADDSHMRRSMNLAPVTAEQLAVKAVGPQVRVMGLIPGELLTEHLVLRPTPKSGLYVAEPENDIVKLAVLERHRATGQIGLGFLKGLGLKRGAVASTVAHDSHNLVVAGVDDRDMLTAIEEAQRIGGGLVVAEGGRVLGSLPLPIGGLLSDRPMGEIKEALASLQKTVRALGLAEGHDPFMTLAFMSLPVIPKLKLTEAGLVDVEKFELVPTVF